MLRKNDIIGNRKVVGGCIDKAIISVYFFVLSLTFLNYVL